MAGCSFFFNVLKMTERKVSRTDDELSQFKRPASPTELEMPSTEPPKSSFRS